MSKHWKKIVAGALAGVLLIGGIVTLILLSRKNNDDPYIVGDGFEWTWTKPYDLQYDLSLPKTTVRVGIYDETGNIETVSKFKKVFENMYPNIAISYEKVGADWHNSMFNYVANGTLPDIIWLTGTDHLAYSAEGIFENLAPYYSGSGMSPQDYYDDIIKTTHYSPGDNGIWFAPQSYDKPVMYYNRKMFDICGVDYPKNDWNREDFLETCRLLREGLNKNLNPSEGVQSSSYPVEFSSAWAAVYYGVMRSFGADVLDAENNLAVLNSRDREWVIDMEVSI